MRSKDNKLISAIEKYVKEYYMATDMSPSMQEIADNTGISKATAYRYVTYMQDQDLINYSGGRRSVAPRESRKMERNFIMVPVLGAVSCGLPKYAEENIEDYIRLPASIFGHGDFFILRANGNSMIEAGIDDGDYVVIRNQDYADYGQIVVALIGEDEATLKRFYPNHVNGIVRLHPENKSMEDIIVESCVIQGVAIRVMKNLEC